MSVIYIDPFQFAAAYDADAQDYINRVIAADVAAGNTSGLEVGVQEAINDFVVGCKADGTWNAIKASCILAGARTLAGALVPLVGIAPDKYGTEGGWNYNRETGLQGNGTDNYLDSNRANNADPQNNAHLSVNLSSPMAGTVAALGAQSSAQSLIYADSGLLNMRLNSSASNFVTPNALSGFLGVSRVSSTALAMRSLSTSSTATNNSVPPSSLSYYVFARNLNGTATIPTTARLNFYSIGESLDLALLDARVTTLMSDLAAAIL
jgi:hypothetical protein